ncbi:MAG TPA: M20 family metallo-hydrolase [Bryobacteraceae bacterium]|nr:M20 family metallo-hydrolase [Bryobacteraceae bacterium]
MKLVIDRERLATELDELGAISQEPPPVVTRVVFSEADVRGRDYVKGLCGEAGLTIREDAVGNTFARWPGVDPSLAPVGTGSHIDAIPNAGRFDGTVGVLGGLEAIRALARAGYRPLRSIELIIFTSEEPTRFGIGCLGSRLLSGLLDPDAAAQFKDRDGTSLDQARSAAGFAGPLSSVRLPRDHYSAFVELHIEQGPILEQRNIPLGVVMAIAAPASLKITVKGEGGHAGAVLMADRHDAFLAAAEIALAVEWNARCSGSPDTVGTVGVCEVFPGAVNSIPSRAQITIDIRDIDEARRDSVLRKIELASGDVAHHRGVRVNVELVNADPPAHCAPRVVDTLVQACETHNLPFERMISRAYHDSLFMSRIAPGAMLFIPCRGGVSHRPDEYASPDAIAQGTLVLAEALARLAEN